MALTAPKARSYSPTMYGPEAALPVQASTTIYAGAALTADAGGEVGPLAAGESFAGFALNGADNSSGSAGDIKVRVLTQGLVELKITGLDDNDDHFDVVYATDDDTFTLTASGAVAIGRVFQITDLANGKALVYFKGAGLLDHS